MGFFALALLPLWIARAEAPGYAKTARDTSVWGFFWTDPTVIWAVVLFGVVEFGVMALIPVWGLRLGMGEASAISLVVIMTLGNVALQIPLGMLADRFSRRGMLIVAALTCLGAALLLPMLAGTHWPL